MPKKANVDWDAVRADYIEGIYTLDELAKKYNVNASTISRHASDRRTGPWIRLPNYRENREESKATGALIEQVKTRKEKEPIKLDGGMDEKLPLTPVPPSLLGVRCNEVAYQVLEMVRNGAAINTAFSSCGISNAQKREWLQDDKPLADLLYSVRHTMLSDAQQVIFRAAVKRGATDAALNILKASKETAEDYTNLDKGGNKINISVQIGSNNWDRDTKPIIIEGEVED